MQHKLVESLYFYGTLFVVESNNEWGLHCAGTLHEDLKRAAKNIQSINQYSGW